MTSSLGISYTFFGLMCPASSSFNQSVQNVPEHITTPSQHIFIQSLINGAVSRYSIHNFSAVDTVSGNIIGQPGIRNGLQPNTYNLCLALWDHLHNHRKHAARKASGSRHRHAAHFSSSRYTRLLSAAPDHPSSSHKFQHDQPLAVEDSSA
jgi:hypothetical protein